MSSLSSHAIFRTEHYASGALEKLQRSFELGPQYYLRDVPRYWAERRKRSTTRHATDLEVLWNPLHEFGLLPAESLTPPPGLDAVLDRLSAAGMTIALKPERFIAVCAQWWASAQGPASVIECGSFRGTTGLALALLAAQHGFIQDVHLFDLFGVPGDIECLPVDGFRPGNEFALEPAYPIKLQGIADALGVGDRMHLHPGPFAATFPRFTQLRYPCRLAHIDANLYASTKQACDFIQPLLDDGAAIIFDDYHAITDLGARLAIAEAFGAHLGQLRRLSGTSAVLTYAATKPTEAI